MSQGRRGIIMTVKQNNYKKHELAHSQARGLERYGVRLTRKDFAAITKIVLSPNRDNKVFQHQQEDGASHWVVLYNGELYRIVFDERTKAIRTMLDMRPIDRELWENTHNNQGKPTIGDVARITRLRLR